MIRKMRFDDIPWCASNVQLLADAIGLEIEVTKDMRYLHQLFGRCYDSGHSWFIEEDGVRTGHILAMKVPDIWNPSAINLMVISLHRHGCSSYAIAKALFKFTDTAQSDSAISATTLSRNHCSNSIDYTKLNYAPAEELFVMR